MKRYWLPTKGRLLSYSAMSKFKECPRKYAFQYIDKIEVEFEEGDGLLKGRAFHEIVETEDLSKAAEHTGNLAHQALARAGARLYMEKKRRGEFPVVTFEEKKIINEEAQFFGIADEICVDEDSGAWMVGEMKTGAKFDPIDYAIAETKHQTALYRAMSKPLCSELFLSHKDFAGLSYKKIIFPNIKPLKGRGKNAVAETMEEYEARAYEKTTVLHKIIKVSERIEQDAVFAFNHTLESIDHLGPNSDRYPKNCNACLHPFFGICPYFMQCTGLDISQQDETRLDVDCEDVPC